MSVCEECGSVECYCVGYKRERAARLAAEARAEKEKWRAEVAEAKSAVYGGEWCLSNRAAGRNRCGACAVCFAEEQARAQAAEEALKNDQGERHWLLAEDYHRLCDAEEGRKAAEEEAARLTTELETVRSHRNTILNYWWPRLGFSCANAMAYGPLGDPAAKAKEAVSREVCAVPGCGLVPGKSGFCVQHTKSLSKAEQAAILERPKRLAKAKG